MLEDYSELFIFLLPIKECSCDGLSYLSLKEFQTFTCNRCKQFLELTWVLDSTNAFIKTCNVLGSKNYIAIQVHKSSFPLCIFIRTYSSNFTFLSMMMQRSFVSYFPIFDPGQYFSTSLHACNRKVASDICHYLLSSKCIQWLASITFQSSNKVSKLSHKHGMSRHQLSHRH